MGKSATNLIGREEAKIQAKGLMIMLGGLKSTGLNRKSTGKFIGINIILRTMINYPLIEARGHSWICKEGTMFPEFVFINHQGGEMSVVIIGSQCIRVRNRDRLMPGTGIAINRNRGLNIKGAVDMGQCISKNLPIDKVLKVSQTITKVLIKGTLQTTVNRIIIGTITKFPVGQPSRRRIWRSSGRNTRFRI